MTYPNAIKNHLERISSLFGGLAELEALLPADQVSYLAAFPGPVFVVAPWDASLGDLREAGYVPETKYSVYNREMQYLYSSRSSGLFSSEQNVALLNQAGHGEYFHVMFQPADSSPVLGIVWVAKQPNKTQREYILAGYKRLYEASDPGFSGYELLFDLTHLNPNELLRVYSFAGSREDLWSVTAIKEAIVPVGVSPEAQTLRITPVQNTWFYFEQQEQALQVAEVVTSPTVAVRWQQVGQLYFFQVSGIYSTFSSAFPAVTLSADQSVSLFGRLTQANS